MSARSIKVLLIEDKPRDARLVREMLAEAEGEFRVEVARRLSTGLKCLAAGKHDLVLLDPSLPNSQGLQALAELKAQAPEVPIVVLTGPDDEMLDIEAVREGAQDYLVKGRVDANLLVRTMRYAIERNRAEKALRESEERYRTLFEDSRDAVIISTPEGKYIDFNQATLDLFGCTREEMMEMGAWERYVDPADRERLNQELEQKGYVQDFEAKLRKKDGTEIDVLTTSSVERASDGSIWYHGINRDITERKRLEEQLRQAAKMDAIGRLAGGVAHDFNNELTAVIGYSELILRRLEPDDPMRNEIEQIRIAGKRSFYI